MNLVPDSPTDPAIDVAKRSLGQLLNLPEGERPSLLAGTRAESVKLQGYISATRLSFRERELNMDFLAVPVMTCEESLFFVVEDAGTRPKILGYISIRSKNGNPKFSYFGGMPAESPEGGDRLAARVWDLVNLLEKLQDGEKPHRVRLVFFSEVNQVALSFFPVAAPQDERFLPLGQGFGRLDVRLLDSRSFHQSLVEVARQVRERALIPRSEIGEFLNRVEGAENPRVLLDERGLTEDQLLTMRLRNQVRLGQ